MDCNVGFLQRRNAGSPSRSAIAALLLFCAPAWAQDHGPPVPFLHRNADVFTMLPVANDDTAYGLRVPLSDAATGSIADKGPVAASFFYYWRQRPLASVRYAFRLDVSALTGATLATRAFQVFAANSPIVGSPWPRLLTIVFAGGSPSPRLAFATPRGDGSLAQGSYLLSAPIATVRVEINVGAGSSGSVRYWIDSDYSEAPTGAFADLDNAAWTGVIGAAIGMSSTSNGFRSDCDGTLTIDRIGSSDDLLFWDDYESSPR